MMPSSICKYVPVVSRRPIKLIELLKNQIEINEFKHKVDEKLLREIS